jgi:hypothetical protein
LLFQGAQPKEQVNVAGTWKVQFTAVTGQTIEASLKLKQDGDKLTGVYIGGDGTEIPIQEVKLQDDELTFQVVRDRGGQKLTMQYSGKVAGDAIKGKIDFAFGGQTASMRLEAKRVKETANAAGTWKLTTATEFGRTFEHTVKLTQDGDKLSGTYIGQQGETPIANARIEGDDLAFQVARERDGKKFLLRYQGKVAGDALKGNVEYEFDGQAGSLAFTGQRVAEPKQ